MTWESAHIPPVAPAGPGGGNTGDGSQRAPQGRRPLRHGELRGQALLLANGREAEGGVAAESRAHGVFLFLRPKCRAFRGLCL
jgi:hypothetical protein